MPARGRAEEGRVNEAVGGAGVPASYACARTTDARTHARTHAQHTAEARAQAQPSSPPPF